MFQEVDLVVRKNQDSCVLVEEIDLSKNLCLFLD